MSILCSLDLYKEVKKFLPFASPCGMPIVKDTWFSEEEGG